MMSILSDLSAEFPRDAISWRAQSVTKEGTKAMALAYIDARDVMDRLDTVVGPVNWQDRYEFHGSRTICYLSIRIDGEWVTKADGAGDSDVEAEKGAISDALKRAAVKWGIGRYLYALEAPWVPCETTEWNGKKQWKRWTADPWSFVKGVAAPKHASAADQKRHLATIDQELLDAHTPNDVTKLVDAWAHIAERDGWSKDYWDEAKRRFKRRKDELAAQASNDDEAVKSNSYANAMRAG
jgi:hypothetical protein